MSLYHTLVYNNVWILNPLRVLDAKYTFIPYNWIKIGEKMNLLSLRLKLIPNSSGGDEDDPKPDPDGD